MRNRTGSWFTVGAFACASAACAGRLPAPAPAVGAAPASSGGAVPPEATPTEEPAAPAVPADVADEDRQIAVLREARASFVAFVERARDDAEFAEAVARSCERIEDIDATIEFLEASRRDRLAAGQ